MKDSGYSGGCIIAHATRWKLHLKPFMARFGRDSYDKEIGQAFLCEKIPFLRPAAQRRFKRSIRILDAYISTGHIPKHAQRVPEPPLPGEIGCIAQDFLTYKASQRLRGVTIEHYRRILSYFISGLSAKGKMCLNDVSEEDVLQFLSVKESNDTRFTTLRQFYQYVIGKYPTVPDYSYIFEFTHSKRKEKMPSFYSAEEIIKIEQNVDRTTSIGKRTYAMLLMASRLGLRISDIIALRFCNIDWDKSLICLTQSKTGKSIELPLLTDVGEAIISYLKVRPSCEIEEVFITHTPPFTSLNRSGAGRLISNVITTSGIEYEGKKHGPHSMRFSLASRLLELHSPLPLITNTLGHSGSDVTMTYLRIDKHSLMQCMLDVPPISDDFYEQENGSFYL